MVTLELVNEHTLGKVLDMHTDETKGRFVAPNIVSLAQAWVFRDTARPFAVLHDGEPVGFLMLDWDEGERNCGVWRFMIDPAQQRKGYGRAAMEAAIAMARASGKFDLMNLDYVPGNTVARDLYASLGFRENGEVEDGEIVMILPLTDCPRIGFLTADGEDMDDFNALLDAADRPVASVFRDRDALAAAVDAGRVTRLTLMAETVGLAIGSVHFLRADMLPRASEVEAGLAQR